MLPDDPRHGTTKGYAAGCRDTCCRTAMMRYEKRREIYFLRTGLGLSRPALGVRRRIEALNAIGWSSEDIARAGGWNHRNDVNRLRTQKWVERKTADAIARIYDDLCMSPGPSEKTRSRARQAGYAPPLAWDDIDIDEAPYKADKSVGSTADEVVVLRLLSNDFTIAAQARRPEREAVVQAWRSSGRSLAELERATGWAIHRYGRQDVA